MPIIAEYSALAARYDALAWPTTPILPPRLSDMVDDTAYWRANGLSLRNSTVANLGDGCAISLPCPGSAPVGLTLASSRGADDALLEFAHRAQSALDS
jgi:aspartyl-tRNA(Asn)/glutamyl-tRNA(Gln) amidotransferase subunit A